MSGELTVRLPIGSPIVRGYQFYAFPLSILATDARTSDWILSNFIQVEYDRLGWEADVPFTFYLYDSAMSPWLEVVRATRGWYATDDIRDLLRAGLGKGYYAHLVVDEYHIPHRRWYGVRQQPHDILVHGVDDRAGSFTVLGFDDRMQFSSTQISQSDFAMAYRALDGLDIDNAPVFFYRLRSKPDFGYPPIAYDLNLGLIHQSIDEYLRSADTSRHFQMLRQPRPCVYGVDTYHHLEDYIRRYAGREVRYDINHLHILWEHKQLMTGRIRRLGEILAPVAPLEAEAKQVETLARNLRNAMLRDELQGGRQGYLDTSLRMLHQIRETETELLSRLLRRLDDAEPTVRQDPESIVRG